MDRNKKGVKEKQNDITTWSRLITWIEDRMLEQSTFDGYALFVVGFSILYFKNLLPVFAIVSMIYGLFRMYKKEK